MEEWQQRVIDERMALNDKKHKLIDFLHDRTKPKTMPLEQVRLLHEQLAAMDWYDYILAQRIQSFITHTP